MTFCFQFEVGLDIEDDANKVILKIKNYKKMSLDLAVRIDPLLFSTIVHFVTQRPFSHSRCQAFVAYNRMDLRDSQSTASSLRSRGLRCRSNT